MSKYLTTKEAAEKCGMKPSELTTFVKKHGVYVERHGMAYLWTTRDAEIVIELATAFANGLCIHCGESWDRPRSKATAEPAAPAEATE